MFVIVIMIGGDGGGGGGGTFPHVTVKIGQCQEDHTSPHDPQTQPTSIKCNRTFRGSHHQAGLANILQRHSEKKAHS